MPCENAKLFIFNLAFLGKSTRGSYTELKMLFTRLSKKAYYETNKRHLSVGLRRFQQWFDSEASDKELIKAKTKPKPEMAPQTKQSGISGR